MVLIRDQLSLMETKLNGDDFPPLVVLIHAFQYPITDTGGALSSSERNYQGMKTELEQMIFLAPDRVLSDSVWLGRALSLVSTALRDYDELRSSDLISRKSVHRTLPAEPSSLLSSP